MQEAEDSDVDFRTENKILEENKSVFTDGFTMGDAKHIQDCYQRIHKSVIKHLKETRILLNMKDLDVQNK